MSEDTEFATFSRKNCVACNKNLAAGPQMGDADSPTHAVMPWSLAQSPPPPHLPGAAEAP